MTRRFLHAIIQLFSLLLSSVVAQPLQEGHGLHARSNAPVVDLGYAQYAGVIDTATGNTEFRGLRYAAPPTGMTPSPLLHRLFDRLACLLQEVCDGVAHGHQRQRRASN